MADSQPSEAGSGERQARRHADDGKGASVSDDQRERFARDRDRVLYCSAFRRLAGVTQVVGAAESHVFHNRLTHSMKAAQVGRRLAERFLKENELQREGLVVDPEVVEAAALAHDLGHPPFGHAAETELDDLLIADRPPTGGDKWRGKVDGFEGNAQTFRILTKLACHRAEYLGLDLTRATLQGPDQGRLPAPEPMLDLAPSPDGGQRSRQYPGRRLPCATATSSTTSSSTRQR